MNKMDRILYWVLFLISTVSFYWLVYIVLGTGEQFSVDIIMILLWFVAITNGIYVTKTELNKKFGLMNFKDFKLFDRIMASIAVVLVFGLAVAISLVFAPAIAVEWVMVKAFKNEEKEHISHEKLDQ